MCGRCTIPFPNEHAARIISPGKFQQDSFRRKNIDTGIDIIIGRLKGETTTTTQSYRFKKTIFTVTEAKTWLKDHDIKFILFEPAEKEKTLMKKTIRITGVNNHTHTYDDSSSGTTSSNNAHTHPYIVDRDKVRILEGAGHTHEPAQENKNIDAMEKKYLNVPFEIKRLHEDEEFFFFEGYASTFGNVDLGNDMVEFGAFTKTLHERMPKLLWQHDSDEPLGIFEEIFEDQKGLFVRGKMPKADHLVEGRVIPQMKIGSVNSMSIGFRVKIDEFDEDTNLRKIKEVMLFEISLVTLPMNPEALITGMKTIEDQISNLKTLKDINNYLRSYGLTKTQVEGVMAKMRNIIKESNIQESQSNSEKELAECKTQDSQSNSEKALAKLIKNNISHMKHMTRKIKGGI